MPNQAIKDKELKAGSDDNSKTHQAYAMELSRLKPQYLSCIKLKDDNQGVSPECKTIINRYNEIESLVRKEREINHKQKEIRMNAGEKNQFQKPQDPTEVKISNVTDSTNHSGHSTKNKIMQNDNLTNKKKRKSDILTNNEAQLNEEISNIRYLIEYMTYNNNNKKQNL